jgi:hypothetical protein
MDEGISQYFFMYKLPEAMLLRFPEYSQIILERIMEVEDFENLCLDYELCVGMIDSIKKESLGINVNLKEFLQLKKGLENEALKYLL